MTRLSPCEILLTSDVERTGRLVPGSTTNLYCVTDQQHVVAVQFHGVVDYWKRITDQLLSVCYTPHPVDNHEINQYTVFIMVMCVHDVMKY